MNDPWKWWLKRLHELPMVKLHLCGPLQSTRDNYTKVYFRTYISSTWRQSNPWRAFTACVELHQTRAFFLPFIMGGWNRISSDQNVTSFRVPGSIEIFRRRQPEVDPISPQWGSLISAITILGYWWAWPRAITRWTLIHSVARTWCSYLLLKLTGKEAKNRHWQLFCTWQFYNYRWNPRSEFRLRHFTSGWQERVLLST